MRSLAGILRKPLLLPLLESSLNNGPLKEATDRKMKKSSFKKSVVWRKPYIETEKKRVKV